MKQITSLFLLILTLYGCSKVELDSKIKANEWLKALTSVDQVGPWTENVKSGIQASINQTDMTKSTDMLNVKIMPIEHDVFFLEKTENPDGHEVAASKTTLGNTLPVKDWLGLYPQLSGTNTNDGKPMVSSSISLVKTYNKTEGLSQAELTQFKYAGSLNLNGSNLGLVKVGERLYRVQVGDVIGIGHWAVVNIEPQKMQLKVAGKTISYERN